MKTNTAPTEHRSTYTHIWGTSSQGNHRGTGKLNTSASAIPAANGSHSILASCLTEPTEQQPTGMNRLTHTSCCCIREGNTHGGRWTGLLRFKRVEPLQLDSNQESWALRKYNKYKYNKNIHTHNTLTAYRKRKFTQKFQFCHHLLNLFFSSFTGKKSYSKNL